MKKSTLLILTLVSVAPLLAAPAPQEFRITDASGQVAVIPKGKTQGAPAKVGTPLEAGDRLVTGNKGRIEVASKEGTVLELKERSFARIQELSPGKTSFFVKVGRLLGRFAPSKQTGIAYRIRTPAVVASVRGTDLAVDVAESGETQGGVVEGVVEFERPKYDTKATMGWSDEDPRLMEDNLGPEAEDEAKTEVEEEAAEDVDEPGEAEDEVEVSTGEGISVKPNAVPQKLPSIPPVIVSDLAWFQSVRERVPKLRDEWKDLDAPTKMKMRQAALRERLDWKIPEKLQPKPVRPEKISPKKLQP